MNRYICCVLMAVSGALAGCGGVDEPEDAEGVEEAEVGEAEQAAGNQCNWVGTYNMRCTVGDPAAGGRITLYSDGNNDCWRALVERNQPGFLKASVHLPAFPGVLGARSVSNGKSVWSYTVSSFFPLGAGLEAIGQAGGLPLLCEEW